MEDMRKKFDQRKKALKSDRSEFFTEWQVLSEFFLPRRGRFLLSEKNKARSRTNSIINSTGTYSAGVLANGMHTGLTNPARPWFRFSTGDTGLAEFGPVKEWLSIAEKLVQAILNESNIYDSLPQVYLEDGVFGTGCMGLFEDFDDVVRAYPFTVGEYCLGMDHRGRNDTLYREFKMTIGQAVKKFGRNNLSMSARNIYDRGSYDQTIEITHLVEPNDDRIDGLVDARNMPFRSAYYENGGDRERMLRLSGFEENPIMATRWNVLGGDTYGTGPGAEALGDNKQIQHQEKKKAQAIDKHVDPPMQAPSSLRNNPVNNLPGGITFYDSMQGANKLEPTYQVMPQLSEMRADMQEVEQRIRRAFSVDMFLMVANAGRQMTATEVAERHEEKLMALGSVLNRTTNELLAPMIKRIFNIALRKGLIPPPPKELNEQQLKIEYISILAQAQQAVATGSIERLSGFAGNLAAVKPEVLDKIDLDQGIDEYAAAIGAPPKMVRSDDDVAQIRAERQKAEQAQQQMAMMQQAADGAKTLSEVQTGEGRNLIQEVLNV